MLTIDPQTRFAYYDGIKLPFRVIEDGRLEFMDKDIQRARERHTRMIVFPLEALVQVVIADGSKIE